MDPFTTILCFTWLLFAIVIANVIFELIPSIKDLFSAYTEYYIVKRNQKDEHN